MPLLLLLFMVVMDVEDDDKLQALHSGNRCNKISLSKVPNAKGINKILISDEFRLNFNLINSRMVENGNN